MSKYVADTMALILRLEKREMPQKVKEKFQLAEKGLAEIIIPAMVFAELAYLSEKKRLDTNLAEAQKYINDHPTISECTMTISTILHAFEIDDIPELHDRLIAASGKEFGFPILSNDPDINNSKYVKAIWKA